MRKKRTFENIIDNLKPTITNYSYYVDFPKVYENIKKYDAELNILNSLIGSKNIEDDFLKIINEYPKVFSVIPLLLAIRNFKVEIMDEYLKEFNFSIVQNTKFNEYLIFMRKAGLFDLFENKKIKNLSDYVMGVEVGMDTNARKNRTGKIMENLVENYIKESNPIEYFSQMKKKDIAKRYGIDIDKILFEKNNLKEAEKKFDFVVKTKKSLFLIETNFFQGGGSKLNETARSFKALSKSINKLENIQFVWITDGGGWSTAKNNLKEAYDEIKHLYTLYDLENNLFLELFEEEDFVKKN